MANIQISLAGEDFRHDALAANLAQIGLLETVLLHQKLQRLDAGDLWQWVMFGFVRVACSK